MIKEAVNYGKTALEKAKSAVKSKATPIINKLNKSKSYRYARSKVSKYPKTFGMGAGYMAAGNGEKEDVEE